MTLPDGWELICVNELAGPTGIVSDGDWVESKDQNPTGGVRLTQLADVGVGDFRNRSARFMTREAAKRLNCTYLAQGDVLIARMPDPIGRACVFPGLGTPAVTAVDVMIWRTDGSLASADWFVRVLNSPDLQARIAAEAGGTTRQRIAGGRIKALMFPTPPLAEQRRIVAKLDGLTTRIARARAELDRAGHLAKAVRTTAVESAFARKPCDLTEQGLPVDGITIQDLVDEGPTNGWSPPSGADATGALTLKLTATTSGRLRLDPAAIKRIYDIPPSTSKFWLKAGDLLLQRANALEHVGATAIYEGPPKTYIYPDLMMRIRVSDPKLTRLLWYYFNSPRVRAYFRDKATGTAGNMPKISGAIVRNLTFPKLSEVERERTLERLDAAFVRADRLEAEAARAAALLDRLEASILAKAFRGELVPQDPADEPASALLDGVRAERAAAPQVKRGRRAVSAASH